MTDALERALETRRWLTPLVLALLTAIFFRPVFLTPGALLAGDDLRNLFYPLHIFVVDALRAGELPLWNPHLYAGQSVIGDPQITLFYPPNWLWLALDVRRAATLLLVAHVAWAAWGMARFTRTLGASAIGGLLGGLIYAFGGWFVAQVWAGHYTVVLTAAWLP